MLKMFHYNWQVRDEWFAWCEDLPEEELAAEAGWRRWKHSGNAVSYRRRGMGWIRVIQGKPDFQEPLEQYNTLAKAKALSAEFHKEVADFLDTWTDDMEGLPVTDGTRHFTAGEILRHVIAHEIHHIGQLSVWSRELGRAPVSANFIERGIV